MYKIEREGAMHVVVSTQTGLPQMRSLKRINCREWIKENTEPQHEDADA